MENPHQQTLESWSLHRDTACQYLSCFSCSNCSAQLQSDANSSLLQDLWCLPLFLSSVSCPLQGNADPQQAGSLWSVPVDCLCNHQHLRCFAPSWHPAALFRHVSACRVWHCTASRCLPPCLPGKMRQYAPRSSTRSY